MIGSDDQLELFCWVLNVSNDPFQVMIGKRLRVNELKKEIKKVKEHTFSAIDPAHTLEGGRIFPVRVDVI